MTIRTAIYPLVMSVALGACASSTGVPSISLLTSPPGASLATGSLPDLTTLGNTPTLNGSVTDVYSRIAGKALTCWFSTDGPLKATHVFSAEAPPPSSGAGAEITIFEKDVTPASPRGTRAYRLSLTRESDALTRLSLQAGKLPPDLAQAMEKDALAWAHGKDSCEARVVRPPAPSPPMAEKKPQKKKRVSPVATANSQPAGTKPQAAATALTAQNPPAQPR